MQQKVLLDVLKNFFVENPNIVHMNSITKNIEIGQEILRLLPSFKEKFLCGSVSSAWRMSLTRLFQWCTNLNLMIEGKQPNESGHAKNRG